MPPIGLKCQSADIVYAAIAAVPPPAALLDNGRRSVVCLMRRDRSHQNEMTFRPSLWIGCSAIVNPRVRRIEIGKSGGGEKPAA
jgi:hypothetical protein